MENAASSPRIALVVTLIAPAPRGKRPRWLYAHHCQIPQSRALAESTYLLPACLGAPAWQSFCLGAGQTCRRPRIRFRFQVCSCLGHRGFGHRCLPQSSSASRRTASDAGFLLLSQSGERPDMYNQAVKFIGNSNQLRNSASGTFGQSRRLQNQN